MNHYYVVKKLFRGFVCYKYNAPKERESLLVFIFYKYNAALQREEG